MGKEWEHNCKGNRTVKEQSSFILFKLNWCKLKLIYHRFRMLNLTPIVTTEKSSWRIETKGNH